MLKKQFRITDSRDFERIYKKGKFQNGKYLKVNVLENRRDFARAAVVISKKAEKSAVKRNEVKRKVREAVRIAYPELENGKDLVINIKKEAVGKKFEDLKKDLLEILDKLGIKK